nr:ATP synthase F0 subunit B [uncultured Holophaga sp.]
MNLRRLTCLALPLALAMAVSLSAEEPQAPKSAAPAVVQEHPAANAPHEATPAGHPAQGEGVHEGEAHHESVKLFGMNLGPTGQFAVKLFNFIIFFLVLYFLLKGVLSAAFKARAQEIQDLLAQAQRDKAEGEAQLRDLETRMEAAKAELDSVMSRAETEAEFEKQRILEAARNEAQVILAQASADIDTQRRLAETELRALVAELAVQGAAERLKARAQGKVAEELLDRAIDQVGGIQ